MIKDNHLAAVDGDIGIAVKRARAVAPMGIRSKWSADTLDQVRSALAAGADVIMFAQHDAGPNARSGTNSWTVAPLRRVRWRDAGYSQGDCGDRRRLDIGGGAHASAPALDHRSGLD